MSLKNGWTGGQYSLFRVLFGSYLFVHFVQLVPWGTELFSNRGALPQASDSPLIFLFPNVLGMWDAPAFVTALLVSAAGLSVLFAAGWHDRLAAVGVWYIWACLHGRMPLISNPGMPFIGWMLLAHACLPPAPFGSWAARGRADPGGCWQMPAMLFLAAWVLMALGYSYSGYTKLVSPSWLDGTALARVLDNPLARPGPMRQLLLALPAGLLHLGTWLGLGLELSFAPLALFRRLRPWLWSLMLGMHVSLIILIDFADLSLGMAMLHGFTFDPAWIRPKKGATQMIFYDGHCGLCHRLLRFVLAEDRPGDTFHFAPLHGAVFRDAVPGPVAATLSDSVVVRTADGILLQRSAAVVDILERLGGIWRILGLLLWLCPPLVRDWLYDTLASNRYRLFDRCEQLCPVVPEHLRERFGA